MSDRLSRSAVALQPLLYFTASRWLTSQCLRQQKPQTKKMMSYLFPSDDPLDNDPGYNIARSEWKKVCDDHIRQGMPQMAWVCRINLKELPVLLQAIPYGLPRLTTGFRQQFSSSCLMGRSVRREGLRASHTHCHPPI